MCRRPVISAIVFAALWAGLFALQPREARARAHLRSICQVLGQKSTQLTGLGLVVGLNGTGDGGKNPHAMRALQSVLAAMNSPVNDIKELRNSANVAVVMITAEVPKEGIRRGQRLDCVVSSLHGAKSLRGGQLIVSPLRETVGDTRMVGRASGSLVVYESDPPTTARIPGGVNIDRDFISAFVDRQRGGKITLLLDPPYSGFGTAADIAWQINDSLEYDVDRATVAVATGPNVIEVALPQQWSDDPVTFVAMLLAVGIDSPQKQARVIVNTRTHSVILTGDVEIEPVVISHKGLRIEVGELGNRFFAINTQPQDAPQQLQDLLRGLKELKVPQEDVVHIVRELHLTGRLHAAYDEH